MEENLDKNSEFNKEISDMTTKSTSEEIKESRLEKDINNDNSQNNAGSKDDTKIEIDTPAKPVSKPKKELPIEKKPFQEFINMHLIPTFIEEINERGLEIVFAGTAFSLFISTLGVELF